MRGVTLSGIYFMKGGAFLNFGLPYLFELYLPLLKFWITTLIVSGRFILHRNVYLF